MNIYFAHGESEVMTSTGAATPTDSSNLPVILAISAVVLVMILVTAKLLSMARRPEPKEKRS